MKNKKKSCPILQEPQIFMLQRDKKHTQILKNIIIKHQSHFHIKR